MYAWLWMFALIAMMVALKLYAWCQMRYWYGPACKEDWRAIANAQQEEKDAAGEDDKEHGHA